MWFKNGKLHLCFKVCRHIYYEKPVYCFVNSRRNVASIKLNCIKWLLHIEKKIFCCSQVAELSANVYENRNFWILDTVSYSSDYSESVSALTLKCNDSLSTYSLCQADICEEPSKTICLSTPAVIKCSGMLAQVMTTICSDPWLVCPLPQTTHLHMSSKIPITSWFSKAPHE